MEKVFRRTPRKACEFVRSKPLSDRAYSRFSDCGYAAENPKAGLFVAVLSTRSPATAVPAPPLASPCAGADRLADQPATAGLTSGLPRVVGDACARAWSRANRHAAASK